MWRTLEQAGWLSVDVFLLASLALTAILIVNLAVRRLRRGRDTRYVLARSVLDGALVGSMVLIVTMTLLPQHAQEVTRSSMFSGAVNLAPFETIRPMIEYGSRAQQSHNLLNNVLLFVPLGWTVALKARGRWPVLVAVVTGVVLSALVELGQWALPLVRSSDVDDVILNGLGTLLGAVGAIALLPLLRWVAHSRPRGTTATA